MDSTMQDFPLTIAGIMRHACSLHGDRMVTTATGDGYRHTTIAEVGAQAARLANALRRIGVTGDQRVATFMWNNAEHLTAYLAIPSMGAVLHTLNIRLSAEQIAYIANEAEDQVIIADLSLTAQLEPVLPLLETAPPRPMPMDDRLIRVAQRFDMSRREAEDRFLKGLGVASVVAHEARWLSERGRPDLAAKVRPARSGDAEGCDVISVGLDEGLRLIVVKTTLGAEFAPFGLSSAEYELAEARPEAFRIRRVYDVMGEARFYRLKPPFE